MTTAAGGPALRKPLRLWPGVVGAVLLGARLVIPAVAPDLAAFAMIGGAAGALIVVVWWLLFSRAPWYERIGAVVLAAVLMAVTFRVIHVSIQNGMMGYMFLMYAIQGVTLALVVWALACGRLSGGLRLASLAAAILIGSGVWTLLRTDGLQAGGSQWAWRWTPTAEERLLAQTGPPAELRADPAPVESPKTTLATKPVGAPVDSAPVRPTAAPADVETPSAWPGFRGADRDGVTHGARIETDWSKSPPVALWRRPVGPGWSSFAVRGDLIYTQEQRGDAELVACYNMTTGEPVWMHRDTTRFWESNGGAGPRATPALSGARVFAFGATGILNALDAKDGAVIWSHNVASDIGAKLPGWGFSSSPLIIDDEVVVFAGELVAYDRATGNQRWTGPKRGGGYSSPQRVTIDGVTQILMMSGAGTTSVSPADGTVLWDHPWAGVPIVQPAQLAGGDLLVTTADAMGGLATRRLTVARKSGGWAVDERWTSRGLKPYFNDFVVHKDHAFGFDGGILSCIDLADGARKWKGGRYGDGQLILLPDQDLLLVLSEEGELALVSATPAEFREIARFKAIEGKTWNHPVLVGDVLLVRNGEEMAAFRLPAQSR
jgi:outer membrane protein assembly factor BamB